MDKGLGVVDLDDQLPRGHRKEGTIEGKGGLAAKGPEQILPEIDAQPALEVPQLVQGIRILDGDQVQQVVEHLGGVLGHRGGDDIGVRRHEIEATHGSRFGEPRHDAAPRSGELQLCVGGVPLAVAVSLDDQCPGVEETQAFHGLGVVGRHLRRRLGEGRGEVNTHQP